MEHKTSCVKKLKMQGLSILRMSHSFDKFKDVAPIPSGLNPNIIGENEIEVNNNEENIEEQQEFSFGCFEPLGTVTFADKIFDNGKIRPTCSTFDQSIVFTTAQDNDNNVPLQKPLKKLFVGLSSQSKLGAPKEPFNEETSKKMTMIEVETSNMKCKKSKSTGFSTWRMRESYKLRSNSDCKDAFVLMNPSGSMKMRSNEAKEETGISKKEKSGKCKTTLSPHEKLYLMNKKRTETSKRKSFLPYRQNLIGFFANTNGFTRITNPF